MTVSTAQSSYNTTVVTSIVRRSKAAQSHRTTQKPYDKTTITSAKSDLYFLLYTLT